MTTFTAPGKVILLGEHAVVYGRPALAAPVHAVHAQAEVLPMESGDPGSVRIEAPDIEFQGWLKDASPDDPLGLAVRLGINAASSDPTSSNGTGSREALRVVVTSDIPPASGLGSSAAVSVAVIQALASHLGTELPPDHVSDLAFEVEILQHGNPSGIDNTVVAYDMPVLFIKGEEPRSVGVARPFELVIGDTGQPSPTKELVRMLRRRRSGDQEFMDALWDSIGELTNQAAATIGRGEVNNLGPLMNHCQTLLETVGVSSPALETLVHAAREAGASGAKLSGAGGGGVMIALVNEHTADSVDQALGEAGAVSTLRTRIP